MPPALVILFKITLAIQGLLWYHMSLGIAISISVKSVIGILIGIVLYL